MKSFFVACIDFIFPAHADVLAARAVSPERLWALYALRFDARLRTYTALPYAEEAVRALIRANKYYADSHSAALLGEVLGEMLGAVLEESALERAWRHALIVSMPPSPKRLREKGYNQVARIVSHLPESGYEHEVHSHVLKRRHRESQARVIKSRRAQNIAGAFYVPPSRVTLVQGRSVFLIDDVCESGSTMNDARRALMKAGARRVVGIALAR